MSNDSSKTFGTIPNNSEDFRSVRSNSERFRTVRNDSERRENHTLTVREVARRFEAAGVSRTERSITNWCRPNKTGIARLDAYFDPNERKYFITPESVEAAIQEELAREKNAASHSESVLADAPHAGTRDAVQTKVLEQEIRDLKIASGVKDKYIELLQSERAEFSGERQSYIERLTESSRHIGELETKLRLIEAPDTYQAG